MSQDRPTWHRRRFLKTTLTTAGGLSLLQGCASSPSPSPTSSHAPAPAPAPPDAQTTAAQGDARLDYARGAAIHHTSAVVQSACTLCNSLCALEVLTRHGRAYAVRAPSAQAPAQADEVQAGQLCVKADLLIEIAHSPKRLTQPLRRVSGQRGDPNARFEPISWPEALRHLARTLLALRDQGLAHTIANRTTGRMLRGSGALVDRFFTLLGSPNATDVGPVCNDAGGYALAMTFGLGQFTNGYGVDPITGQEDLGQAKLLLFLGTNQAETHPVTFAHLLRQRERTGAKLIVVDPRQTPTGALADSWIAPKPHTDLAIVLGMLSHIIEHKLHDAAFVSRWVLGFDELATHLKAQGCSAAWADAQADLAPGTTAWLARSYATTKPAAIFCNAGISHQMSAFDTYRALTFLAAITGQIGVPGAGCNFMHNTWPGALALPPLPHSPPTITQPALPQGPDSFAAAILDASPYPLRVIISQGNPLHSSANTSRVRQAYSALDLFVYTGLFMEESALWADLILPVTSGLETEGVYMRRDDRGIRWQEAAIARVGQAKTDVELWIELAHAMADLDTTRGEAYWRDAFPRAWLDYKTLWDEFIARTPGAGGLTRGSRPADARCAGPALAQSTPARARSTWITPAGMRPSPP